MAIRTVTANPSRLPMATARRLDRLAARAHRFHRFAHHPLCTAYAGETVRLGRRARLCRGCAAVVLGTVLGVALGLALPVPTPALLAVGVLGLAAAAFASVRRGGGARAVALRFDRDREPVQNRARASKHLTRTLPAAFAAGLAVLGTRAASGAGLAVAAGVVAIVAWGMLAYRRRGPDRAPCLACPERVRPQVCTGFAPLARREKAFSRLAGRLVRAVPPPPPAR